MVDSNRRWNRNSESAQGGSGYGDTYAWLKLDQRIWIVDFSWNRETKYNADGLHHNGRRGI
jgi:hypothetical protein